MATNVRTGQMSFPYSLGRIIPGAAFAGASVPLTQNVQPVNNDGVSPDVMFNSIWIQAHVGNTGTIYICGTAAAPDLVNFTNVLGELTAGQWYPRTKEWANNRSIAGLFIGAENATDFAIVSIDQF